MECGPGAAQSSFPQARVGSGKQQKSWDSFSCGKWTNRSVGIAGRDLEEPLTVLVMQSPCALAQNLTQKGKTPPSHLVCICGTTTYALAEQVCPC